jgi:hypothetical protein
MSEQWEMCEIFHGVGGLSGKFIYNNYSPIDMQTHYYDSKEWKMFFCTLLAEGWEPFHVENGAYFFRRRVS